DNATPQQLAAAIAEWVGTAAPGHSAEDATTDYAEAGLDYAPPRQPMETLDELARVLGMTPAVLSAIRPHLTVYGPRAPDPAAADPTVAAALAFASGQRQRSRRAAEIAAQRGGFITVRINATAHGPENAEVRRTAIIRFSL